MKTLVPSQPVKVTSVVVLARAARHANLFAALPRRITALFLVLGIGLIMNAALLNATLIVDVESRNHQSLSSKNE